jgi:hypothetical protein
VAPRQIPSHCPLINPTKAQVDEATNQCVNALTRSSQLRECVFEDYAGRAEDKRTGLSCPDRQAALARQCLKRCANYASDTAHLVCTGSYPNTVWHISFGDIPGDTGNSARVDLCGPPLRSIFAEKPPPVERDVRRCKGNDLVYAGKVYHGLDKKSGAYLRERLTPLIGKTATMGRLARELGGPTRSD